MEETKTLRELQKEEAIKRLKLLDIIPDVIQQFIDEDVVQYSEKMSEDLNGILYWITNHPEFVEVVKHVEEEHNCLVYHAELQANTYNITYTGDFLCLLFVSNKPEDWEKERRQMEKTGQTKVYIAEFKNTIYRDNFTLDSYHEGVIKVKPCNGGIARGKITFCKLDDVPADKFIPQIGDHLYLSTNTGNYCVDDVKNPYTVIKVTNSEVTIQACKLIFNGLVYYNTVADDIEEDPNGDIKVLHFSKKRGWYVPPKYYGSNNYDNCEIGHFGEWKHQPYLD